jgi:hypothetical protein
MLQAGAISPDLVNRLTAETCKVARHVLRMCIRALDYCPPVDITFGEYLRALITADLEMVPNDRYGYRVAFMEAFRKQGILPTDVRTVSEETLSWNTLEDPKPPWLKDLISSVAITWNADLDRSEIFKLNEQNRWSLWRRLRQLFQQYPDLYAEFGLLPEIPCIMRTAPSNKNGRGLPAPSKCTTSDQHVELRPTRNSGLTSSQ